MIPGEAVEAALAAQLSFKNQRGMDNSANLMRHILEAAAPHIIAEHFREMNRKAIAHEIESPLTYVKNEGKK